MAREKKRPSVIFIVFIIVFSFTNQIVISNVNAKQTQKLDDTRVGILQRFARIIGKIMTRTSPIIRFFVASAVSKPPIIEIGYNETVEVELGIWDLDEDIFEIEEDPPERSIYTRRYLNFEAIEFPGGSNDQGSWFVTFNPWSITIDEGTQLKTKASITLTSPPSSSNPIQSGILKIRMYDTWAYGNVWLPAKGSPMDSFTNRFLWLMGAILTGYGKLSGTVITEYLDINILVKVKPYHALRFETVPIVKLSPDQIISIPVQLQNLGNYNDSYIFKIASKNNNIKLSAPYSVTLAPGETKNTYLGVSIPQNIFDYGTLHQITIEAYSADEPDVIIEKRVINIESKGVYISEIVGGGFAFLTVIIILGIAFFVHRRRIYLDKYCIKPDKPWEIPEEKTYLEKLKKRDEKKFNEVTKMMQDEYTSAILWYKDYCRKILEPKPVKKTKKEKIKLFKIDKIIKPKKPKKEEKLPVKKPSKEEIEAKRKKSEEIKLKEREKKMQEKLRQKEINKKLREEKLKEKQEQKIKKRKEKEIKFEQKKIQDEKRRKQQVLARIKREQKNKTKNI